MAAAPLAGLGMVLAPGALRAQGAGDSPAFSEEARRRLVAGSQATAESAEQLRQGLLAEAEQRLDAGRAEAALETLERAALVRHTADTELRIVRAQMALGHYRRALAFAAHTAGAHREQRGGVALYAWLLHSGGQELVAQRLLADALRLAPEDALLAHTSAQIASPWPSAGEPLRQKPWQAAPAAFGTGMSGAASAQAAVVASATLLNDGRSAVLVMGPAVDALLQQGSQPLWVRNGLGHTVAVRDRRTLAAPGMQLLLLDEPLSAAGWAVAPREPFSGSPGSMVEYAPDGRGRAAWPLLRQGFFAGVPGTGAARPLGIPAPHGPRGGPVFDAAGRLVGLASGSSAGDVLIGLPQLRQLLEDVDALPVPLGSDDSAARRRLGLSDGPELAYEAALRGALQVLVGSG